MMIPVWQLGNLVATVCSDLGSQDRGTCVSLPGLAALTSQPLAMAKPPPRRRMMFQGTVS